MSLIGRVRRYYEDNLSIGDRLGEAVYAVWMVTASIGLLNTGRPITPDHVMSVIAIALAVNFVWGAIDGITVMLTNTTDRARLDLLVFDLRTSPTDTALRARADDELDDTFAGYLNEADRARVIDMVAAAPPGPDPRARKVSPGRADWLYALAIICIDVGLALPVLLPLLIFHDFETAILISRIVATYIFAALGAMYARQLRRNPWIAAVLLGAFGHTLFVSFYEAGW
ncbi:MAG: hypothetical protein AB7O56_11005 [Bauldia sp.]